MFENKKLLITGGTGSFGNAVLRRFLDSEIAEIRIFSRDEKKQDDAGLCREIEVMRQRYGLKVKNDGELSHQDVLALYPSTFESFGLPLIEARQAGVPVLASELDYVRNVLDPEQTFDPDSSISIARAVKRFTGMDEQPIPLLDATGFMASILGKAE